MSHSGSGGSPKAEPSNGLLMKAPFTALAPPFVVLSRAIPPVDCLPQILALGSEGLGGLPHWDAGSGLHPGSATDLQALGKFKAQGSQVFP